MLPECSDPGPRTGPMRYQPRATLALGLWGLAFRSVLAPGVTVSVARSDDPVIDGVELMLKGGQMGGDRLFDDLAAGTA